MRKFVKIGFAGRISLVILISRFSGYVRDICVAAFIGASPVGDALMAAFKLTNLFRAIFSEGAMSAALVPAISQSIATHGSNYTRVIASHVFSTLLLVLILFTVVIFYQMENFILVTNPGFTRCPETFSLAVELAYIMFPYLTFISASAFYGAVLQTKKIFIPYAGTSIILNSVLISSLYINDFFNLNAAVYAFAYGLFISGICELSWMIFCSKKYNSKLYLRKPIMSRYVRIILKRILPGIFGAGIVQISVWCDMLILSFYVGGISYLYFADRIIQLPLAIFSTANSIVLLQSLSKAGTTQDEKNTRFNKTFRITLGFILPSAAGIFLMDKEAIEILFMRGAFTIEAATKTGIILQILSIALPFQAISKLYYAAINATGNTSTPVRLSLISLLINISLSLILMSSMEFRCVAIATVISSAAQFTMLMLYCEFRYTSSKLSSETKKDIIKCFVSSIVMIIVLSNLKSTNISLIALFSYVVSGAISYIAVLFLLKAKLLADLLYKEPIKSKNES